MNTDIQVLSVNISNKRGPKFPVDEIDITKSGIEGDSHCGSPRPVSISIVKTELPNEFVENITLENIGEFEVKVFDKFSYENLDLEVIKVIKALDYNIEQSSNKERSDDILCRVSQPGKLSKNSIIKYTPKVFRIKIVTLSDRASRGEYEDISGPTIKGYVENIFNKAKKRFIIDIEVIPDDQNKLKEILLKEKELADVIITTGGTGIGPRDFTVDIVQPLLDKEIPGIMEMIRIKYGMEKPNAYLSRGVAGIIGKSLIYTLPGSVKAVKEYMTEIGKTLDHLIYMQHGIDTH